MDVFIGNLPASATINDIRILHGSWDFDVDLKRVHGTCKSGREYHYFIAHFGCGREREAERLIRQLEGLGFPDFPLEVREYIHRSSSNERRALDWRSQPWDRPERRLRERRQGHFPKPDGEASTPPAAAE